MKFIKTHKKMAVSSLALVVALVTGGAAYAFFTSSGTGTGSARVASASPLTVTVSPGVCNKVGPSALSPCLYPTALGDSNATWDTTAYKVTNPAEGNVGLSSVLIEVTPGFTFTDANGDPACTAADFSINGQLPGTPDTVTPTGVTLKSASDSPLNSYTGSFTIQMVDNGANQDSCQGVIVPLTVTANPSGNADLSIDTPPPSGSGGWYPNPTFVSNPTITVGEAGVNLLVTAIQNGPVNAVGTFTLSYDNTYLTFTGAGDGTCAAPTAYGDVSTVSCSFTDLSHSNKSVPFDFTTLKTGSTSVYAVVSITGSGTASESFPLTIS